GVDAANKIYEDGINQYIQLTARADEQKAGNIRADEGGYLQSREFRGITGTQLSNAERGAPEEAQIQALTGIRGSGTDVASILQKRDGTIEQDGSNRGDGLLARKAKLEGYRANPHIPSEAKETFT